jgi:fluoride exporter
MTHFQHQWANRQWACRFTRMHATLAYVVVFIGGGLGSALRFGVGRISLSAFGPNFPIGTLMVNIVGCFVLGVVTGWIGSRSAGLDRSITLFLATGVLGGFTTFSAFALDAVTLSERGDYLLATGYVLASVLASIVGLIAGLALMRTAAT